jgi:hypothetical protein
MSSADYETAKEHAMQKHGIWPAELAPAGAILAVKSEVPASALADLMPFERTIAKALDRVYGPGEWFMFWDEDLSGKPIRGTVCVAFGHQTMVIG